MNINDFYANGGTSSFLDRFATMLNIPNYRVRIVGVFIGSVILYIYILPYNILSLSGTEATNTQNAELQQVLQNANNKYNSGEMESVLNITLKNFTAEVIIVLLNSQASGSGTNNNDNNEGPNDDNDNGGIIGIPIVNMPSGINQGISRSDSHSFSFTIANWGIAICSGLLLLIVVVSGLVLYVRNAVKEITLKQIYPDNAHEILDESNNIVRSGLVQPESADAHLEVEERIININVKKKSIFEMKINN